MNSGRQLMRQLEEVFRALPDDIQVAGVLASVHDGDAGDVEVAAALLSRAMRSDVRPLHLGGELKTRLRNYLKESIDLVLAQDDFNGEEKAHMVSALAQAGEHEDMADLQRLIKADIERRRRGRTAYAAGDRGPLSNGANMSYATWHIAAVMQLIARRRPV
jgi:thioredoxin-like negative regulator of GroEL